MSEELRFVLVKRKTRLEDLINKYNTVDQAKFYIEHMGIDFDDYLLEDKVYQSVVRECTDSLQKLGKLQVLDRAYLANYLFDSKDTIVIVGQDGLVANTLKYLKGQSVVAINPDVKRWEGILLPFTLKDLPVVLKDIRAAHFHTKRITLAKAVLNNGQTLLGVNDIFIGQRTHVSARYLLQMNKQEERQSSSGIIISTGLGSTGWLKSVMAGAASTLAGYSERKSQKAVDTSIPWDAKQLIYSVREPYPSRYTGASLVHGKISVRDRFTIQSQMAENGCIFSDGIENDFLEFNSGAEVSIQIAEEEGILVV